MKTAKHLTISVIAIFALCVAAGWARAQNGNIPEVWVGSWAASQQIPEPQNAMAPADLRDATVRQIVRLSVGGSTLRLHLSNAFGSQPLLLTSVHIARAVAPGSSAIVPGTDRALTFDGRSEVTVPAGAEYLSDPVDLSVTPLSSPAITFYLKEPPVGQTGHPGSRATSYFVHGDHVSDAELTGAQTVEHWYQIGEVDVLAPQGAAAIVALGDSITDGHASTTNGNDRWTDVLAERLQTSPATHELSVLNEGIGGNHLLTDGLGPNALARFNRDVLAPAGVRWVIVFEGVNDLGGLSLRGPASPEAHKEMVQRILSSYQQIIERAHAHGLRVIGATITPFVGSDYYHPDAAIESDREDINTWIRALGHFDAVLDFDKVVRDPAASERLLPAYDCGDHLHPNPKGYRALGDSVPMSLFSQ
jgi:lysophospholipase L1-like esterase